MEQNFDKIPRPGFNQPGLTQDDVLKNLLNSNEILFTVSDPKGLHWKPSGEIVEIVKKSKCSVIISFDHSAQSTLGVISADARSILQLLMLPVKQGGQVKVKVYGPDSSEVISKLLKCQVNWIK